jgi:hypothetical protein
MDQKSPATRARAIVGAAAAVVLVISFALVATLINRQQSQSNFGAATGCAAVGGKLSSPIVSASASTVSNVTTFTFTFTNQGGGSGVPGLIKYCAFFSGSAPSGMSVNTTASGALGFNGTAFVATSDTGELAFTRDNGGGPVNEFNIPLDASSPRTMGTATFASAPGSYTFLFHIIDAAECTRLYGSNPPGETPTPGAGAQTCWVLPHNGTDPTATPPPDSTPTNTPAGEPTPTPTPPPGSTPTNTPAGVPTPTPTIIPTPTGTPPSK